MYTGVMLNIRGPSVEKNGSNFYVVAVGAVSHKQNRFRGFFLA